MDLLDRIRNEPVLVTTIVSGILVILVQFGIEIDQTAANTISGLIVALATLFARSQVTPTAKLPTFVKPTNDDGGLL